MSAYNILSGRIKVKQEHMGIKLIDILCYIAVRDSFIIDNGIACGTALYNDTQAIKASNASKKVYQHHHLCIQKYQAVCDMVYVRNGMFCAVNDDMCQK